MADRQFTIGLNFEANTQRAKTAIQDLTNSLTNLSMGTTIPGLDAKQIDVAAQSAKELAFHLNKAFDVNTGKLNLNALNQSLTKSGTNLQTLSHSILQAGATGQKAFVQLAQSISMADAPLIKTNALFNKFWDTLKRTAGWQVASTAINGVTGAVKKAIGYAEDLNKSLNDIRIVTGYSADKMASFAKQANTAAKLPQRLTQMHP